VGQIIPGTRLWSLQMAQLGEDLSLPQQAYAAGHILAFGHESSVVQQVYKKIELYDPDL